MRRTTRWICILLAITAAGVFTLITFTGCRQKADTKQLPIIYITTDNDIQWEKRIPCTISIVSNGDSTVWDGKIKFRGGISSKYDKHSFSLKLSEAHHFLEMPANRSWILNARYIDKTFMRHKLCYDLFNMMGDNDIAPRCQYALLRENGKPLGLYVIMQRLNKQTLHLDTDDTASAIFKEPKVFYPENQYPERNGVENFHEQTYPDFEKGNRNYLMDAFRKFLTQTPDQEFYAHIGEWIDIPNLIDYHLFLLFTNGGDGVKKIFYLYKKDKDTPYRIAPWDCDHSFGRDGDNEKNMLERLLEVNQNILNPTLGQTFPIP